MGRGVRYILLPVWFASLMTAATAQQNSISLDLTNENIEDAMRVLSDATGFTILLSNKATGTITAYIQELEPERALRETVEVNGYRYVRNDDVVWVLTSEEYFQDFNLGREQRIISLTFAQVHEILPIATEVLSPNGQLVMYPDNNVVVLREVPGRIDEVASLIRELDVPETTRVFQLQHASAQEMLQLLVIHDVSPDSMYADFRTNQISVRGTEDQLARIADLLSRFDQPDQVVTRVVQLKYATAQAVAELLREVLTGRSSTAFGPSGQGYPGQPMEPAVTTPTAVPGRRAEVRRVSPFELREDALQRSPLAQQTTPTPPAAPSVETAAPPPQPAPAPMVSPETTEAEALGPLASVTADPRTNTVIITHTLAVVERLEEIVRQIDVPNAFHVYQFRNVNPADIDVETKLLGLLPEQDAFLNVDPIGRTVTFRAGAQRADEILQLLELWDSEIRQVRIDAEILSVNASVVAELGIAWQAILGDSDDLVDIFFPAGVAATAAQGRLLFGNLAENDYMATIQALATDSDTQRIASPRVLVRDGEEAVFSTARDEPFTVVTVDGNTDTTLEDVRFLNVGVNFSVTPVISSEDMVTIDVVLEISDLVEIRDGIPVVDRSTAQSSISVSDGGTAILGGLRQSSRGRVTSGVPGLRKIPIIGNLFRSKRKDDDEFEILLILRPFIQHETPPATFEIDELEQRTRGVLDQESKDSDLLRIRPRRRPDERHSPPVPLVPHEEETPR